MDNELSAVHDDSYHVDDDGEIGSPRHVARLYQLMRKEYDKEAYTCASLTMQWIQQLTDRLYLTEEQGAVIFFEIDNDPGRCRRIDWKKVTYV